MRMLWLRIVSRFQRRWRPAMMRAAVEVVVWILEAVAGWRVVLLLVVAASFWRLFISSTRSSRRTDGGGMLVGRTFEDGAVFPDVKLSGGGLVGVDFCLVGSGAGAGVVSGPSLKSPQSSKASSSHSGS